MNISEGRFTLLANTIRLLAGGGTRIIEQRPRLSIGICPARGHQFSGFGTCFVGDFCGV